jgi:hypothetical protein
MSQSAMTGCGSIGAPNELTKRLSLYFTQVLQKDSFTLRQKP